MILNKKTKMDANAKVLPVKVKEFHIVLPLRSEKLN